MKGKCDNVLVETLDVKDHLVALLQRTCQKSLDWLCYWGTLLVRDKVYRHGTAINRACQRCAQDDAIVLHALIQCLSIAELWVYVEYLLSHVRRIRLSNEAIVKIDPPPSFNRKGKAFLYSW